MSWFDDLFIDRQIYERRPRGVRTVFWSGKAQKRLFYGAVLACLAAFAGGAVIGGTSPQVAPLLGQWAQAVVGKPAPAGLTSIEEAMARLEADLDASRKEREAARSALAAERAAFEERVAALGEERDAARSEVADLSAQLATGRGHVEQMSAELAELRAASSEVNAARTGFEEEVARRTGELQSALQKVQDERAGLGSELDDARSRIAALEAELAQASLDGQPPEDGVDDAERRNAAELEIELAVLERERDAARDQLQKVAAELAKVRGEPVAAVPVADSASGLADPHAELAEMAAHLDGVAAELQAVTRERDEQRVALDRYVRSATLLEQSMAELEQEAVSLESRLETQTAGLDQARVERARLADAMAEQAREIERLTHALGEAEAGRDSLDRRAELLTARNGELETALAQATDERDRLANEMALAAADAATADGAGEPLAASGDLEAELQARLAPFVEEAEALRFENAQLAGQIARQRSELEDARAIVEGGAQALGDEAGIADLRARLDAAEAENARLRSEIAVLDEALIDAVNQANAHGGGESGVVPSEAREAAFTIDAEDDDTAREMQGQIAQLQGELDELRAYREEVEALMARYPLSPPPPAPR